jgi:hypothetical protein
VIAAVPVLFSFLPGTVFSEPGQFALAGFFVFRLLSLMDGLSWAVVQGPRIPGGACWPMCEMACPQG